nr:uncharacterized protein LOC128685693 [Cherax quadricarinatus]
MKSATSGSSDESFYPDSYSDTVKSTTSESSDKSFYSEPTKAWEARKAKKAKKAKKANEKTNQIRQIPAFPFSIRCSKICKLSNRYPKGRGVTKGWYEYKLAHKKKAFTRYTAKRHHHPLCRRRLNKSAYSSTDSQNSIKKSSFSSDSQNSIKESSFLQDRKKIIMNKREFAVKMKAFSDDIAKYHHYYSCKRQMIKSVYSSTDIQKSISFFGTEKGIYQGKPFFSTPRAILRGGCSLQKKED